MADPFTEMLATLGAVFLMILGICAMMFFVFYSGDGQEARRKRAPELVKGMAPVTYSDILIFGRDAARRIALRVEDKAEYPDGTHVFFCSLAGSRDGTTRFVPVAQVAYHNIEIGATIVVPESSCAM